MVNSTSTATLKAFNYAGPFLSIAYFIFSYVFNLVTLREEDKRPSKKITYRFFLWCILAVFCSYVADGFLLTYQVWSSRHYSIAKDEVTHVYFSALIWGCTCMSFFDTSTPSWNSYVGVWVLGFISEIVIFSTAGPSPKTPLNIRYSILVITVSRLSVLTMLSVAGVAIFWQIKKSSDNVDEERQPLISAGVDPRTPDNSCSTTVVGDGEEEGGEEEGEEEDEDPEKDVKQRQRQRLEQRGGWLGYIKDFLVFLPYIWPFKDRKVQMQYGVIGVCLLIERGLNVLVPHAYGKLTNTLAELSGTGKIPWAELGVWILFRYLDSYAGILLVNSYCEARVAQFSYKQIQKASFAHVMGLSMDFHVNKNSGELMKAITQGYALNGLVDLALFTILPMLVDLVLAVGYLTYLFDIYVAYIVITISIAYVWVGIKFTTSMIPLRRKYHKIGRDVYVLQTEPVNNWQTVAYFNRAQYQEDRLVDAAEKECNASLRYRDRFLLSMAIQFFIIMLGLVSATLLAIYRVSIADKPIGSFVALVTFWGSLTGPLSNLANSFNLVSRNLISAERLLQLFNTKSSTADKPTARDIDVTGGHVKFEDVDFSYDERKQTLKNINIDAPSGKTIAFVGETGGGKSTTLKLLLRFYDVKRGRITIDGQDIRDITQSSLRNVIGVVPQDPSLFNMSIMENIRYARLEATDEEVFEACKAAAIHNKILSFPDGYRSKVGERGVKLSGGELQRVSIARVILKQPRVLILDEATSAVDSATENEIQNAFKELSKGRTTFVIAHRLSTIMYADLILVVENGEIVERGTHNELLNSDGKYSDLWSKQLSTKTRVKIDNLPEPYDSKALIADRGDESHLVELSREMSGTEGSNQSSSQSVSASDDTNPPIDTIVEEEAETNKVVDSSPP
ncbi:hypothetical protein M501DRAFT_985735 [Patellaria atrata CBS 101060]|uniref:Heavy metal tolerance protein n=1 Tax=Patellaria atrata CBS 101060 TaxID=1346257 RepID=A0A9P4SKP9_9PEZI|nr:hypothetical protein M501DRAFT_985735 [Patellaria atrata CBS 101060]